MPEDSFIDIVKDIRDTKYPDIVQKHNEVLANTISAAAIAADIITMKNTTVSAAVSAEAFLSQMRVIADENIAYFEAASKAAGDAISGATVATQGAEYVSSQMAIFETMSAATMAVTLDTIRNKVISSAATSALAALAANDSAVSAQQSADVAVSAKNAILSAAGAIGINDATVSPSTAFSSLKVSELLSAAATDTEQSLETLRNQVISGASSTAQSISELNNKVISGASSTAQSISELNNKVISGAASTAQSIAELNNKVISGAASTAQSIAELNNKVISGAASTAQSIAELNSKINTNSITIETTSSPVLGLLYNVTDDVYKRVGKNINYSTIDGFNEFSAWRSPTAERQNDADTASPSPLTAWLDTTPNLPYSQIGRYVIDNTGAEVKKYNADSYTHADQTGITTTQQVMCPIPLHQYISARIVDGGKTYFLYMVAKNAFTVNAITDLGFVSPTITVWNPIAGVSSGTAAANNIASATSLAHVATYSILPTAAYGAFNAVNGRSICGSGVKATGSITRTQARTQCQAFGANFNQIDFFLESTKNILVLIERGSFYMERGGASMANKWEGYSWNSSGGSNDQDNGKTLSLLDKTGVILDGSNRTIANSWRGIENYHSALWRWVDGVNLASNVVYLAKRRAAFDDTSTTTNGYFSGGITVPGANGSYISDLGAGTFIPTAVAGSATTKMTDAAWTGSTALSVGGALAYPSTSGVCAWSSADAASASSWILVARPGL